MYVLVEYNNLYEKILTKLKKSNFTPIILFKINFNNKNQIKEDINKLIKIKNDLKIENSAILINLEKQLNDTNNIINQLKKDFDLIIGQGGLNKTNKFFIEQTRIDFILNLQDSTLKPKIDFIHHFNSGINHILLKEAKEKEINFIYSLNNFNNKYNVKEIGRINQNIKLSRKYKNEIYINFIIQNEQQIKSIAQLNSILSIFEISTVQQKQNTLILEQKINQSKQKKSEKHISNKIYFN